MCVGLLLCKYAYRSHRNFDKATKDFEPRPKDRNILTQHIVTLLVQHLQAPAKRSQHQFSTLSEATCCARLASLVRGVAICLVLKIKLVRMPGRTIVARTWLNDYNIMQHPQMLHEPSLNENVGSEKLFLY